MSGYVEELLGLRIPAQRVSEGDYTIRTRDGGTRIWDFSKPFDEATLIAAVNLVVGRPKAIPRPAGQAE